MRMLRGWVAAPVLVSFLAASAVWGQTTSLTLIRGQNQDIAPGYTIGRTAIGDPAVADFIITEGRQSVVLVPKAEGTTNFILFDTQGNRRDTYQINVVPNLNQLAQNLAQIFANVPGLEIAIRNNRIVVSGSIYSDRDYQLVQDTLRPYGTIVITDIRLDPEALRVLADEITRSIGREEIEVRVVRDRILLEGFAYSERQVARAEAIARSLASDRVVNVIELREEGRFFRSDRMVHFDIKFMEIGFQNLKDWGLDWGDIIRAESALEFVSRAPDNELAYNATVILDNFFPNINILVREGAGKLLLNPRLVVKNGESAREVVDGGEVPVVVVSGDNVNVSYKEFGIIVEVAPLLDSQNNVDTNIKVSAIFPAEEVRVAGVIAPSFTKDEIETNVVLREGQTLILTGLISNRLRRGFAGWPVLSKIPLIRHFFGTKQLDLNKSELVIFVTPTILAPGAGSAEVDQRLQQKLQFDLSVEPRFSTDFSRATTSGGP
jgi:pilus assembly protein CpaC